MKVILSYNILFAYISGETKAPDVHLLIDILLKQGVSVLVDPYSTLLLYMDGLQKSPASAPLKGCRVLPMMDQSAVDEAFKNDFINYADSLNSTYGNYLLFNKTNEVNARRLITLMSYYYHSVCVKNNNSDIIISNDQLEAKIAHRFGIEDSIYSVDYYIERARLDFPQLPILKSIAIDKIPFSQINVKQPFFDSYRNEYKEFDDWFSKKSGSNRNAYVVSHNNSIFAFLALKIEGNKEDYTNITPSFSPKKRLKISSFKVALGAHRISERFMSIVFSEAVENKVDEIYVTLFDTFENRRKLESILINYWGFNIFGKTSRGENVLVRDMNKQTAETFRKSFPFHISNKAIIIPIGSLDEKQLDYGIIRHVYVADKLIANVDRGSIIMLYSKRLRCISQVGVIEDVITSFNDVDSFVHTCKKRSRFTDIELRKKWKKNLSVIKYLHNYNLSEEDQVIITNRCHENNLLNNGISYISEEQYKRLISNTQYEEDIIVDKA